MFSKFCSTRSMKAKFSSLSQRLGVCFSARVLSFAAATVAATLLPGAASAIPIIPAPSYSSYLQLGFSAETFNAPGDYVFGAVEQKVVGLPVALVHSTTTAYSGAA